ncbi:MAG: hypothetical protein ABSE06_11475 [Anaerolineaceae bacterium]
MTCDYYGLSDESIHVLVGIGYQPKTQPAQCLKLSGIERAITQRILQGDQLADLR